jgi:hypothetical protein
MMLPPFVKFQSAKALLTPTDLRDPWIVAAGS